MRIQGDGFLSKTGLKAARRMRARHRRVFQALQRSISEVRAFAASQEVFEQATDADRQKIIALVLTARVLEISEAALLVIKHGMSNEANTLFRVFLDAYFVIANVCSDSGFVANYVKSDEAARLKLLNVARKHDSDLFKSINEHATEALHNALRKKIAEEQIQAFNSYAYAENVGCADIYDSMYRIASGSLHTTPRALEVYFDEDRDGNVVSIKHHPLDVDVSQRAYDFAYFLIKVLSGLREVFGGYDEKDIEERINNLNGAAKSKT